MRAQSTPITSPESRTTEGRRQAENKGETSSALSAGTNALLRLGAGPALCADDVLEAIGVVAAATARPEPAGDAGRVLAVLRDAPATADEIAHVLTLPAAEVAAAIVELELDGRVFSDEGIHRATSTPRS